MGWRDDKIIPDQKARITPSIAAHDGLLHMVHLGDSSNDTWYATFDGDNWSENVRIPSAKSWVGPTLAGFEGGRLHMVHLGDSSHDIWHNRHDHNGWADDAKVPNQQSSAAPSIAEFDGKIHMVHLGSNTHDIWHAAFDGNSWSDDVRIPNQKSWVTPSICAHQGKLHMVHLGDKSGEIWHATFDGNSWSDDVRIPDQMSKGAPALAELNGRLHMVHMGWSRSDLWHSILKTDGWSVNFRLPNQEAGQAPHLAAYGEFLYVVHLGTTSHTIWYSQWDPNYVYPTHRIWVEKPFVEGTPETGQTIRARAHRRSEGTDPPPGNLSLELRQDREFSFDKSMKTIAEFGVNVDAELRYDCPGKASGDDEDSGEWRVFAKAWDEDGHESTSGRTTVRDCRQGGGGPPGDTTARTSMQYRIEALTDGTNPPDSPVRSSGTRISGPDSNAGVNDFDETATGDWQHVGTPPLDDYFIARVQVSNLRPGRWAVQAASPPSVVRARCEVDLEAGANESINFQERT